MLTRRGFAITTAANGHEALESALSRAPDLAVLDGIMPGLEGHEVCARMREDPRTADVPIVLLTAKAGDAGEREADSAGASAFVEKPFGFDDLERTLRALLSGEPAEAP